LEPGARAFAAATVRPRRPRCRHEAGNAYGSVRAVVTETGAPGASALERVGLTTAIDRIRELKAMIALEIEQTYQKPAGVLTNGTQTVTSSTSSWTMNVSSFLPAPTTHQVAMLVNFPELEPAGGPGGGTNPLPTPDIYDSCRLLGPGNPSDFTWSCSNPEVLITTINGCANTDLYQEHASPILIQRTDVGSFTFGGTKIVESQVGTEYEGQCPSAYPACAGAEVTREFGNVSLNDIKIIGETRCGTRWRYAINVVDPGTERHAMATQWYGLCCLPAN